VNFHCGKPRKKKTKGTETSKYL